MVTVKSMTFDVLRGRWNTEFRYNFKFGLVKLYIFSFFAPAGYIIASLAGHGLHIVNEIRKIESWVR